MLRSGLIKRLFIAIVITIAILATYFSYFLVSNEAPIIQGQIHYGIAYKDGLTLDIYTPLGNVQKPSPVIVFFHGGGWITGRKESINFNRFNSAVSQLRKNGYAVVAPEYTLATKEKSPFPHCLVDAHDVIGWIRENAEKYHFDMENVGLFGESAGGHIAMMTAYANPELFEAKPQNVRINYVVDIYGPTDIPGLYNAQAIDSIKMLLAKLPAPLERHLNISERIFGFDPDQDSLRADQFMKKYSPVNYVTINSPPTLILQGTSDILVPLEQSKKLKTILDQNKVQSELHILENVNHAFIGASKEQSDSIQQWVTAFILKHTSPHVESNN
ncbi:MAG: alpha/beta hydrolase [Cyclobacteriaceae bacterium]